MSNLYYFNPLTVTKEMLTKDVIQWSRIYNLIGVAVCMNDRSATLRQPLRLSVYDRCKLPSLEGPTMTYDDCADKRAQELWELSKRLDKPLGIMWSGGIDSTMIVVSFLRQFPAAELKDRVRIVTSTEATFENPTFYKDHVLPNFDFIVSERLPWLFDGSHIIVSGELNDQLFGSDLIRNFLVREGSDNINSAFNKDFIFNYINSRVKHDGVTSAMVDAIITSSQNYGVTLEKNTDFFWWYNFCFKWQAVHFRFYALTFPRFTAGIDEEFDRNFVHPFFETADFQRWSIRNPQVRYINDWKNYKLEAKQSIYNFDGNKDYYANKIKRPSLQTVFYQRPLNEAVTDNFEILEKFNPTDFYNPDNDFK
jgi:hypothetical protein